MKIVFYYCVINAINMLADCAEDAQLPLDEDVLSCWSQLQSLVMETYLFQSLFVVSVRRWEMLAHKVALISTKLSQANVARNPKC